MSKATTLGLILLATAVSAQEGHDHGEPAPAPVGPSPGGSAGTAIRLPEGSLLAPKPVQRLLGLRTAAAEPGDASLNGRPAVILRTAGLNRGEN